MREEVRPAYAVGNTVPPPSTGKGVKLCEARKRTGSTFHHLPTERHTLIHSDSTGRSPYSNILNVLNVLERGITAEPLRVLSSTFHFWNVLETRQTYYFQTKKGG